MAIDYRKLMNWPFAEVEQTYTHRDTCLYGLGLGLGADPLDAHQLRFVYEEGLSALPTMAVVLAGPGFWMRNPESGIDWKRLLHGEQGLVIHKPLPPKATVVSRSHIDQIIDKGADKGAMIYTRRDLRDKATGELYCEVTSTSFCRGDGGFGGPSEPTRRPHAPPQRPPDLVDEFYTLPQAALIYRLSGDYNPLHADPVVAKAAGFDRPILHGLCTYGIAGVALLRQVCAFDASKLKRIDARFSSPVYPGEALVTQIWTEGNGRFAFCCRVKQRDIVVLNNGYAEIAV